MYWTKNSFNKKHIKCLQTLLDCGTCSSGSFIVFFVFSEFLCWFFLCVCEIVSCLYSVPEKLLQLRNCAFLNRNAPHWSNLESQKLLFKWISMEVPEDSQQPILVVALTVVPDAPPSNCRILHNQIKKKKNLSFLHLEMLSTPPPHPPPHYTHFQIEDRLFWLLQLICLHLWHPGSHCSDYLA